MATQLNGNASMDNQTDDGGPDMMVFEDKDHQNSILDNLNQLRKSKQFCDVILQVSDR